MILTILERTAVKLDIDQTAAKHSAAENEPMLPFLTEQASDGVQQDWFLFEEAFEALDVELNDRCCGGDCSVRYGAFPCSAAMHELDSVTAQS